MEKEYLLHLDFDLFSFMNMWSVGKHFSSSKVLSMPCWCKPAAGAFQRDQSSVQRGSFKWPAWESFYLLSTVFPIQTAFLFVVDDFVAQVAFFSEAIQMLGPSLCLGANKTCKVEKPFRTSDLLRKIPYLRCICEKWRLIFDMCLPVGLVDNCTKPW